jgi:hypothetical protein
MSKQLLSEELTKQLESFQAKREALRKESSTLTDSVIASLQTIITVAPGVEAIRWQQWIPGFNDGDACEFTVGELQVKFSETLAKEYKNEEVKSKSEDDENEDEENENGDGFVDMYDLEAFIKKNMDVLNHDQIGVLEYQHEAIEKLWGALSSMENELESRFGAGMQITVSKDGIETEDYDCGY